MRPKGQIPIQNNVWSLDWQQRIKPTIYFF